jgi:hypothetical protein
MSEPSLRIGRSDRLQCPLERRVKPAAGASTAWRRAVLSLAQQCSIGLDPGEYGGSGSSRAPRAAMASATPATWCTARVVPHHDVARPQGRPSTCAVVKQVLTWCR